MPATAHASDPAPLRHESEPGGARAATPPRDLAEAHAVLEKVFGYKSFRSHQRDIVETVLLGGDALVLMPTGGGKSLCYQIPALSRPLSP